MGMMFEADRRRKPYRISIDLELRKKPSSAKEERRDARRQSGGTRLANRGQVAAYKAVLGSEH